MFLRDVHVDFYIIFEQKEVGGNFVDSMNSELLKKTIWNS